MTAIATARGGEGGAAVSVRETIPPTDGATRAAITQLDPIELRSRAGAILNRHPAVGFALGVVHDGTLEFFHGHGLANIGSHTPITEETVFRIGSITKPMTAIAVMQLWERGLVDLDAPANAYLRAYRLVPGRASFGPATVRHLLTHTAGIPEVVHVADLFHPGWGPFDSRPAVRSVKFGKPLPPLAGYYRSGLPVVAEPGSAFAYTNHGFATLGQLVEDVGRMPLERYLREQIFAPLGMESTALVRSDRVASRLATGYALGPGGAHAVPDRDWFTAGATNIYSTIRDLARFAAALLGGGANQHGAILKPATLAAMFAPHYQPDPRLTGMGLGFFRHDAAGHRLIGHDGIMPGFHSSLLVAPDDGLGLIALTNGSSGAMIWLPIETSELLRHLLGVPPEVVGTDIPHHPEIWGELCGTYQLPPRVSDLRGRVMMGGVEVLVRSGQLLLRVLSPIPTLSRASPLHPDDEHDPYIFRLDLAPLGMSSVRLVFAREAGVGASVVHTDLGKQPLSFHRRPAAKRRNAWCAGAAGALALTTAVATRRARLRADKEVPA